MTEETIVIIPRINCAGCVKNVKKILQALPGVDVIAADAPTKTVRLRYTPEQTALDDIKSTLAEARYPITSTQPVSSHLESSSSDLE